MNKNAFFKEIFRGGDRLSDPLELVFPQNLYCISCADMIPPTRKSGLCDKCTSKVNWISGNPLSRDMDEFSFDDLWACCIYGSIPRNMITSLKLQGNTYTAKNIASLMADRLAEADGIGENTILAAVPMHKKKKALRGFNQAELLIRFISEQSGLRHIPDLLIKTKNTSSMRLMDAFSRRSLMSDIFEINEKYQSEIENAHIILTDDVVTTGSTSNACALVLKNAGAAKVSVLCFACGSGITAEMYDSSTD